MTSLFLKLEFHLSTVEAEPLQADTFPLLECLLLDNR